MRRVTRIGKPPSERRQRQKPQTLADVAMESMPPGVDDPSSQTVMVIGSRAGTVGWVPDGYMLAPCDDCGHQVWVDGSLLTTFKVVAFCTVCVPVGNL